MADMPRKPRRNRNARFLQDVPHGLSRFSEGTPVCEAYIDIVVRNVHITPRVAISWKTGAEDSLTTRAQML